MYVPSGAAWIQSCHAKHDRILIIIVNIITDMIMMTVLTCSLDLTTSMGMATNQLQIPAIPPANSVDQIESPVLTKLRLKYILAEN